MSAAEPSPELMKYGGEICRRCGRRNCVGFQVADDVWFRVVGNTWEIVCPSCFDELAETARIVYSFEQIYPVTWSFSSELPVAAESEP